MFSKKQVLTPRQDVYTNPRNLDFLIVTHVLIQRKLPLYKCRLDGIQVIQRHFLN